MAALTHDRKFGALRATQYVLAYVFAVVWLVPFLGIVVTSVSPFEEVVRGWWNIRPENISLSNYVNAWAHPTMPIGQGVGNSFIVTIPATILPMILGSMAAYGFLRFRFPLRRTTFIVILLLLAIPQHMVAVPLFRILRGLELINRFAGLIIAHSAWGMPWIVLFLRGYFSTLPIEVEESARMEGATALQTYFRVIVPMSWPGLASVFALQFSWVWNDFFLALITIYHPDKLVATQRIPLLRGQYHVDWGILTSAAVITTLVPLVVFIFLQKYYVKGFIGFSSK
ncbi:MAG: carbohydrate ABC transporter permease [Spirochaetaceae bacterium]